MNRKESSDSKRGFAWPRNQKLQKVFGLLKRIIPVQFFRNLKVSSKLILGFLIVALIAGVIGLIGIYNIYRINQAEQEVYHKNVAFLSPLERLSFYFQTVQANTGKHILDSNNKFIHENAIKTAQTNIDLLIAELQKGSGTDSTVKNNLDNLKGVFEGFWKEEELILEFSNENNIAAATQRMIQNQKPLVGIISSVLETLFRIYVNKAKYLTEINDTTAKNTIWQMTAMVGLGLFFAIGLGLLIARWISKPMKLLTVAADKLADGDVGVAISPVSAKDEIAILTNAFVKMVDSIREQAAVAERIAAGDLNLEVNVRSENDVLAKSMMVVITTLQELIAETRKLTDASSEGHLGVRGDADKFTGEYQKLILGFNDTLDAVVGPLQAAVDYMERIGRGDLPEVITGEYRGDYNLIKDSLNACIMGIKSLVDESLRLSVAASAGQLTVRGDLELFSGEYRRVIQGMNATMDAVVAPLTEAKGVLGRMAVNDFTVEMTGSYQGMLKEFADEINLVRNQLLRVQEIFIRVAQGDISQLEEYRSRGKESENDQLVPAAIKMMESIQNLIDEAEVVAKAAAVGQLEVRGNVQKLSGKYQNIILGMNQALDNMGQPIIEALNVLEAMAQGDLSRIMEGQHQGDYARIQGALNATVAAFNQILGAINVAAEQVASASRELSVGSQAVSQGASEQAATIQELSASTTAIATQIKQNALLAGQAARLANATKLSASRGNDQMQEMLQAMRQINEAADNISKIIKVIDEIAFQTNILALNAAVEAARAGQSGKGFTVVAQEVRNLAGCSANAAKETAELIESSLRCTAQGAQIANQTAEALSQMVVDVTKTVDLMENIAAASNEQATGITEINQGVDQVAIVTQNNTATAEESAASSEELLTQAENLRRLVGKFRLREVTDLTLS